MGAVVLFGAGFDVEGSIHTTDQADVVMLAAVGSNHWPRGWSDSGSSA